MGAESFSCPHCNAIAHQDWFSLFLKPEKGTDVVVLTLEAALMLVNAQDGDDNDNEGFTERLSNNAVTYEYQKHPRTLKVKLVNVHVSTCYNCNGFALWVRDELVFPGRVVETPYVVIQGVQATGEQAQELATEHAEKPANDVEGETDDSEDAAEDFEEAASILKNSPRGAAALMRICIKNMMPLLNEQGARLDDSISALVSKGLEVQIQQSMDALQVLRKCPFKPGHFDWTEDKETATKLLKFLKGIMERRMLYARPDPQSARMQIPGQEVCG